MAASIQVTSNDDTVGNYEVMGGRLVRFGMNVESFSMHRLLRLVDFPQNWLDGFRQDCYPYLRNQRVLPMRQDLKQLQDCRQFLIGS
jgi:hypothetical protein